MSGIDAPAVLGAAPVAHGLPVVDVLARFDVHRGRGLSAVEAAVRARRFGPNVVARERGAGWVRRVLAQLNNPLIYVLLAACAVTLAFGEFVDAGVIGGVVVLNAVIGYVQESRAIRRTS